MGSFEKNGYRFTRLSESDFACIREDWDALHSKCNQSVFTCWSWMHSWWLQFKEPGFDLFLVAIRKDNELVALLPCYLCKVRYFKTLSGAQLLFIGDKLSGERGFRSEYLGFICSARNENVLRPIALEYLCSNSGASELALRDMPESPSLCGELEAACVGYSGYMRETARDATYQINLSQTFSGYVSSLGKGTKARLFGSRKKLERLPGFAVRRFESFEPESVAEHLRLIKGLYAERWATGGFDAFTVFLQSLPDVALGGVLVYADGQVIAATLNVEYRGRVYNLLLGFKLIDLKRVSLGLATLGYDIEHYMSMSSEELVVYDLLAGAGKKTNYKAAIASKGSELVSRSVYLSGPVKWLFLGYDFVKRYQKS